MSSTVTAPFASTTDCVSGATTMVTVTCTVRAASDALSGTVSGVVETAPLE